MKEVGGPEELQRATHGDGGWKGRARQIVMLKARVNQLEGQLRSAQEVREATTMTRAWYQIFCSALSSATLV